jgi:hypothetical protein
MGEPIISPRDLEQVRAALGQVDPMDLSEMDTPSAHHRLGSDVRDQVRAFVMARLVTRPPGELHAELVRARQCAGETHRRIGSAGLPHAVREALETYLASLDSWAEGARLDDLAREAMGELRISGAAIQARDLAFLLQTEAVGCQTGLLRDRGGGVFVWHTEEDHDMTVGGRFDRLRLFTCRASPDSPSPSMTGFVYPDLMPGPAFGWCGPEYAHAVDAYYLRLSNQSPGIPANAVTWVCLYLGGALPPSQVARWLAPIQSGYALSSLSRTNGRVEAGVVEFLGEACIESGLGSTPGAWTFTVNMLSPQAVEASPGKEDLPPEIRRGQMARIARVHRAMKVLADDPGDWEPGLRRLLAFRVGGDFATSNPSVKATFIGRVAPQGASFRVDPGPGLRRSTGAGGAESGFKSEVWVSSSAK